ncbi:MAG: HAMP domain-containing histidine kinase [Proteobacteria bacterium]|nr:HAMP domain-containing histidine kinase [Pseudomonadota bacterium]
MRTPAKRGPALTRAGTLGGHPQRASSSLFGRMLVAHLVPSLLLLALFGWLIDGIAARELEVSLGRRLTAVAQAATSQVPPDVIRFLGAGDDTSRTARRLHQRLDELRRRTRVARIFVLDGALRSRADTDARVRIGDHYYQAEAHRNELQRVFRGGEASSLLFIGRDGRSYKTGYAALRDGAQVIAALGVEASPEFVDALASLRAYLILAGLGISLLLVAVTLIVARRVTRPLRQLANAAARIGAGQLETPVAPHGRDEVGVLATTMNQMRVDLLARERQAQLMLAGIAHEVRNPLGGIALFAGLLREELAEHPTQREMVARIERETEHLKRIVTEFLDYARRSPPQLAPTALAPLLAEVAEVLANDAQLAQVVLRHESEALIVPADAERLRRLLLNLARNAIQACSAGGQVTLRCALEGEQVVLEVIDDGCGIPAALRERVLEPFFTTRERGTGLGLALSQHVAEDHGGTLEVHGDEGRGTTIRVTLPAAGAAPAPACNREDG